MKNIPTITERADYYNLGEAANQGRDLPHTSAQALECALAINTEDIVNRARLLGYYAQLHQTRTSEDAESVDAKLNHILWFLENAPDCKFAGDSAFLINREKFPKHYQRAREAWLKQVKAYATVYQVAINAAMFCIFDEPVVSKRLLKLVSDEDRKNPWAYRLLNKLNGKREEIPTLKEHLPPTGFDYTKSRLHADKSFLDTVVFHGSRMPPCAAHTLEMVLAKFPDDVSARVELIGFYSERWKRENFLGFDADYLTQLTQHVRWCIRHIPGSKFLGDWHGFATIDKKIAPVENKILACAWDETVKLLPEQATVLATAAAFYYSSGAPKRAEALVSKARKLGKSDPTVKEIIEYAVGNCQQRGRKQPDRKKGQALSKCAISLEGTKPTCPFGPFTLAEWVSAIDLNGAHLEGVYHWVPPISISNLNVVLSDDSADAYNRAKIIGSYDRYYSDIKSGQK
jgi:hypothetical protein